MAGNALDPFIAFFRALPEKSGTTCRFFDRSDYYTVHGKDAVFVANELFRSTSVIKEFRSGDTTLQYVVVNKTRFEAFVRELLLVRQFRVEVYREKQRGDNNWELLYKASPGNFQQFEEVLFGSSDMSSSPLVLAVKLGTETGKKVVGVASVDTLKRQIGVCEFVDGDQFSNLESLLVQLGPKECLVTASSGSKTEAAKLHQVISRSGVLLTERKKGEFSSKDVMQDLARLIQVESAGSGSVASMIEVDGKEHGLACVGALIKYMELLSDDSNFGCFLLRSIDLSEFMRLDAAASAALHLEPSPGESGGRYSSLYGLLNQCQTPQGQRLLRQWIKQPLLDHRRIEERLSLVELLVREVELRHTLQEEYLKHMPDFLRVVKKFLSQKARLQDCVQVYNAVKRLPALAEVLRAHEGQHCCLLQEVFEQPVKELAGDFLKLVELVETTVDLDKAEAHEFVIKSSFDEGLQQLWQEMDTVERKMAVQVNVAARDLGLEPHKTVKLESNSQLGHYLRVTRKMEKNLRGQSAYTILDTRNDGVRFTNSKLQALSEECAALREQYETAQEALVEEVVQVAAGYCDPLQTLNELIAKLDVLVSFAHVSSNSPIPYVKPVIIEKGKGDIVLKEARHPCLEMQDDVAFIANSVALIRDQDMFQIITGPNMGGKSTYIRQVGVIVLMAQIGCFVPCSSATISIVDCILARVGASDSQLKGVSTFMAEMMETANILKVATSNSLVIIDELGRGTSTYDGFGLAWAISEHISQHIGCFCLFATHFHELTALADVVPTVSNYHLSALTTGGQLTLLYKVTQGVCDQSFGIHVAELAHFPSHVIEFARRKASELEVFHNPTLSFNDKDACTDGDSDVPGAKRKKVEGMESKITEFLSRVVSLPLSSMTEEEFQAQLDGMRKELAALGDAHISDIIGRV